MKKLTLVFFYIILMLNNNCAANYEYKQQFQDKHIIHVLKIDPNYYSAHIVKSNDSKTGREEISSLAQKHGAEIAINGGFFNIGGNLDGFPSGTLIVEDKIYKKINKKQPLVIIKSGALSIKLSNPNIKKDGILSAVSGIPMLVQNGEIFQGLYGLNSDFYIKPHARTAIGIDKNGQIIIVVAEHYYPIAWTNLTLNELKSFITVDWVNFAKKYNKKDPGDLTLKELKEIIKDKVISDNKTQGLNILELAKFMKDLDCQNALNLDGGGSSALWIKGNLVNNTLGNQEEANSKQITRSISDAIIFKKK